MKIKVRPEDFLVEEIADIPSEKRGGFGLYILEKRGWNTVDLLKRLSREFGIPFGEFAYGGKKDRHALTRQHITIKGMKQAPSSHAACMGQNTRASEEKFSGAAYSLIPLGFVERPMGPDLIKGNRFEIVIRCLADRELQSASAGIEDLKRDGYPNYFDDQRFGSFDSVQGFVAEKVLRGHHKGAVKIYFTHIRKEDKKEEKERKLFFTENWGDWQECSGRARTEFEKAAFGFLTNNPTAFVPVLQRIPSEEMSLLFSAYQSYLWNELMRRIVKSKAEGSVRTYAGVAGEYIFYERVNREDLRYLKALHLPTPAANTRMPDALTATLYAEVLTESNIRPAMFNIRKVRQAFFKSTEREAIVIPEGFSADSSPDEIYRGKRKLILKFTLPRGSYGTMLVKRLFSNGEH